MSIASIELEEILVQKVLIEMDEASENISGSMIIKPEESQEQPWSGIVKGFGEGRQMQDGTFAPVYDLYVGQRVLFNSYVGYKIPIAGSKREHRMLEFKDILCELSVGLQVG